MRSLTAALAAALVLLPAAPARAANQPPVAVDDAADFRNVALPGEVQALANDSDPDGDPLVYTGVTPAAKGEAYVYTDGRLYYRPFQFGTGTDSFTYTVSDGQGNTATGTVTITLWSDLPAPGGLALSSGSLDSATLTWPAAPDAVRYQVFRNTVLVHTTSDLTWTDSGLLADRPYSYRIAGVNGGGYAGPQSDPVYRQQQPPAPEGLTVELTTDPTTLALAWSTGGMLGPWNVYRDGVLVASRTTPDHRDTGLVTGREYSYQVQLAATSTTTVVSPAGLPSAAVRGTPVVLSAIGRFFLESGGSSGALGPVTVPERAVPGGRQQDHANGIVLQQDGQEPLSVTGSNRTAYVEAGGATGDLGFPLEQVDCTLVEAGCVQWFEGGSIWSSGATSARAVLLVIEEGWSALGWEEGPLGYPVGDLVELPDGVYQDFEYGAVYWSEATGSHGVASPIYERWADAGWEAGALGYPVADEVESAKGLRQSFTGGTIWWSPSRGTQVVSAALQGAWARAGWAEGALGEPTAAERVLRAGRFQTFTGGSVYWSPATGAHSVLGAIRAAWSRVGWENGPLGYPTTDRLPLARGGGQYQKFQGGSVYWSPATGAYAVRGAIRTAWGRAGWENGSLGYPVSDELPLARAGGRVQKFQGGSVYWSPRTGAHPVRGAIRAAWGRVRYENGRLGYPTTDETGTATTRRQGFQGGTITFHVRTGRTTVAYR